jgi:hypothetical protein
LFLSPSPNPEVIDSGQIWKRNCLPA